MTITRFGIDFNLQEDKIYLDSATIGKLPVSSLDTIVNFYQKEGTATIRGVHSEAIESMKKLENNRKHIADFFKVEATQVSFLPSKETALTNALFSLEAIDKRKIVTSILEDHSILAPVIKTHQSFGTGLEYLNFKDEEELTEKIHEQITSKTDILILSSLTPTNGIIRDWKGIAKLCQELEATFILDISNSVGHEPIELDRISPDIVLTASCVGALGPQGLALQILSNDIEKEMNPLIVGGGSIIALEEKMFHLTSSGSKFECGIMNLANISGLTNSLELLSNVGLSKIQDHELKLSTLIRKGISNLPGIELIEIKGVEYGPITTFASEILDANDTAIILDDMKNIIIRSGALCAHLFMYELPYNDLARISTHLYNTEEEINILIEFLEEILSQIET
ncbi:MAG: aminotransferase class V-fold PLP-dependent enzyme [Candidatus Heimdallarchaeota archaeon]|nr:aminotransferase class V-fold PLP-dependent enzyme [Candidatus Heimdallarchaeota archaeon]MCK4876547.1 aminotransferase class V-fold PLP-dependent enzyme [Candidatus Heimdallarchaeota archaeon]